MSKNVLPRGKQPTLEQQLHAKNQEDCEAAARIIDGALAKYGCQLKFRMTTQVRGDGVVVAIEERYVVKAPAPKTAPKPG